MATDVAHQPVLGRVADTAGYAASYPVSGAIAFASLPFLLLARRENASADFAQDDDNVSSRAAMPDARGAQVHARCARG